MDLIIERSREYFVRLVEYSKQLLDRLPIEREPQPLAYALGLLQPAIQAVKKQEIEEIQRICGPKVSRGYAAAKATTGVGLNSVGMLTDRLTILIMKEWCLRNKGVPDPVRADRLYKDQTLDIIEWLAGVRPGSSSLNTKITGIVANTSADRWEEAYYGLFTTNIILWESQEVLYMKDISKLPAVELRDYVKWFSFGNIMRNEYIQWCEVTFWKH